MRLIVLDDNIGSPGLLNEWGWSIYVEGGDLKMLFDADTNPRVIEYNSGRLGVDLSKLDFAFLSHRHGDHSGGFSYVAEVRPGLKVYTTPDSISELHDLNLDTIPVHEAMEIARGVWSTGPLSAGSLMEHGMIVETPKGYILFVGCSHPGVDVLAERALEVTGADELFMVIGGFHRPPRRVLDRLAEMTRIICPAHCSGGRARDYVRIHYPEKYCMVRTGSIMVIGE